MTFGRSVWICHPEPATGYALSQRFLYTRNWDRYLILIPAQDLFFKADGYELLALQFLKSHPGISIAGLVQAYSRCFRHVLPEAVASIVSELERIGLLVPAFAKDVLSCPTNPLDEHLIEEILRQMGEMKGLREKNYCQHPLFVSIDVTDHCNLHCKHCRTDASRLKRSFLPRETIFRLLEELDKMQVFSVQFSGGEPFVREDMGEILRFARALNSDWLVKIATNGTLVTDQMADLLQEVRINLISVSIDGLGASHDLFREQEAAFQQTVAGIKRLAARQLYVLVNTVIHRGNVGHFEEMVRFVHDEVRPSGHRLSIIFPAGRGRTDPNEFFSFEERQGIWERYLRLQEQYPDVSMSMPFLDYLPKVEDTDYLYLKGCVAGKSHCAIQACGDVSPCKLSLHHIAGNIHAQSMSTIWSGDGFSPFREFQEEDVNDHKCHQCKYLRLCRGGCRIVAYRLKGDFKARDPWCELDEKAISPEVIQY